VENILYVRSKRVSLGKCSIFGIDHVDGTYIISHPSGMTQTYCYPSDDKEAIDVLNQAEMVYKVIDLACCSLKTRLLKRMKGIRTPTMIWDGRKIVGIKNIRKALRSGKANPRNEIG
jgi:hypothetical protein